jgi:hypothetical protein
MVVPAPRFALSIEAPADRNVWGCCWHVDGVEVGEPFSLAARLLALGRNVDHHFEPRARTPRLTASTGGEPHKPTAPLQRVPLRSPAGQNFGAAGIRRQQVGRPSLLPKAEVLEICAQREYAHDPQQPNMDR